MKIRLKRDLGIEARHGAVAGAVFEVERKQENPTAYFVRGRDGGGLMIPSFECEVFEDQEGSNLQKLINEGSQDDRAYRELVYLDEMILGLEYRLGENTFNNELTALEVELARHQLRLMRQCRESHSLRISLESELL